MLKIAIVIGSTRPGGHGKVVGQWAYNIAQKRDDADFTLLDIADFNLPLLDEPMPAMSGGRYTQDHTRNWSAAIASFDGYVFVTPEYNHGTSGALKNAIDFLYQEWSNKAAGFIAYGYSMGARAVESLRLIMGSLEVATVRAQVGLSLFTDFEQGVAFTPAAMQEGNLRTVLDQVIAWSGALKTLRVEAKTTTMGRAVRARRSRADSRLCGAEPHDDYQSRPRRQTVNKDLGVWTYQDCALVLIDYQKEMFEVIRSETKADLVELNVRLLARTAKAFNMPIVLSTVGVQYKINGPTRPAILADLPGVPVIDRTSMNAFEDDAFRAAVTKTGRKRLIFGGLHTEICLTFATWKR